MLSKIGLRAATILSLVNRFSSGSLGKESIGHQIDSLTNGVSVSFVSESLALNPQTTAGTEVIQQLLSDTIGSIASPTGYLLKGNKSIFRIRAGDATTGGVAATSGIYPYSASYPKSRGVLAMQHGDQDGASVIALDQLNVGILPGYLPAAKNAWSVSFEIAEWKNKSAFRTVVLAELGVSFGALSIDPAVALSASDFACFELSQGQIRFKTATYTSSFVSAPNSKDFELAIGYSCDTGVIVGYLNGNQIGQTTIFAATPAQIVARTMHKTAYVAATAGHEPIGLILDSIQANCPLIEA